MEKENLAMLHNVFLKQFFTSLGRILSPDVPATLVQIMVDTVNLEEACLTAAGNASILTANPNYRQARDLLHKDHQNRNCRLTELSNALHDRKGSYTLEGLRFLYTLWCADTYHAMRQLLAADTPNNHLRILVRIAEMGKVVLSLLGIDWKTVGLLQGIDDIIRKLISRIKENSPDDRDNALIAEVEGTLTDEDEAAKTGFWQLPT
ncbi:hypothetical protein ACFL2D_02085 [Patescibacteria group bacterium]